MPSRCDTNLSNYIYIYILRVGATSVHTLDSKLSTLRLYEVQSNTAAVCTLPIRIPKKLYNEGDGVHGTCILNLTCVLAS